MASSTPDLDAYKDLLSTLYRDQKWPLERVKKYMESHYGVIRSAGQYERRFKKWEWKKNGRAEWWRCVGLKVRKRKRAGLESEVVFNGMVQCSKKIRRNLTRYVPELTACPEDGTSPQLPPEIQVRTPLPISDNGAFEQGEWVSTKSPTDLEDFQSLILRSTTKLPSFVGLEILQEAFFSRMTGNRIEEVDGSTSPTGRIVNLDDNPETTENQLVQGRYSITDTPGFHIGVWCNTGVVPSDTSAECNVIREVDALLSTFDMTSSLMPILGVDRSILRQYLIVRRVFVLSTSNQLAPNSKALKSLLPLLESSLSQALLKELISADKIAGQDFVETLLHCAIYAKNSSIVAPLLRLGCNPNRQFLDFGKKKSLLRLAAEKGNLGVIKRLVDAGANINGMPPEGRGEDSPLVAAIGGDFLNVVKYLLRSGSQVNCRDHLPFYNRCALAAAAQRGNLEMTKLLLTAYNHVKPRQSCLNTALSDLISCYRKSDQDGRNEILEILLAAGADLEYTPSWWPCDDVSDSGSDADSDDDYDNQSRTALVVSAERGYLDFVATLLKNGAQVRENAVLAAIRSNHADLACLLLGKLKYGNLDHSRGYEMLQNAVDHKDAAGNIDLVRALLKAGASPNKVHFRERGDRSGRDSDEESDHDYVVSDILNIKRESSAASPLEIAAERGHVELFDLLLSAGAWITPPEHPHYQFDIETLTALDRGAKSGTVEIIERLLKAGADIPTSKEALFHVIDKVQNSEMVQKLIQGGVDVNESTEEYGVTITPLQAAVRIRNVSITQMLLDAGANKDPVKPCNKNGRRCSALCDAIKTQDRDLINVLLQSGADINNPPAGKETDTALEAAVANEDLDLVLKLLQLGSDPNDSRALLAAAMPKHPAVFLETLLHWSVSIPRSPDYGCAALQIAIRNMDYGKVQRLLEAGVRCDRPASESGNRFRMKSNELLDIETGLSALGSALIFDQGQCGPMLRTIFARTNPNALVDYHDQRTGLQLAVAANRCDLAQFLIAGGADVNFVNFNCFKCRSKSRCSHASDAPICIAVARGYTEISKLLLRNGARIDVKDKDGDSLLTLAASSGNTDLVQTRLSIHNP